MGNNKKIRIGCASAFWGDTSTAANQLVQKGDLIYLIFDFLAEVSMSILAAAKIKNPKMGYAADFVDQVKPLLAKIKEKNIKVISNAGGINPNSCKVALENQAEKLGVKLNIAVVEGDNLTSKIATLKKENIVEMESKKPLPDSCLSINSYLGASGIVKALQKNADIVITGRCVDSALVLGPLMHEFEWKESDYDLLSSGSLAGHIIECGAQCTGGNFTDWKKIKGFDNMGFPFVDVFKNGDFIVSKPPGTGGTVTFGTVAEQFLYEIGNPKEYILPDVICDFTNVTIKDLGSDKVMVQGAKGWPPTNNYKVSATYMNGYRIVGTLVIGGQDAKMKGKIIAEAIFKKCSLILEEHDLPPFTNTSYDLLGSDSIYQDNKTKLSTREIVLRLVARHPDKVALTYLSKEMAQATTGMAPGVINYLGGRPSVSPSIHLFSFLYPKSKIKVKVKIDRKAISVKVKTNKIYKPLEKSKHIQSVQVIEAKFSTQLINLAYARSGDKGDHANIGVIAREAHFFPYLDNALNPDSISKYFSHVLKGSVLKWIVPGINGINFLLMNSLGGGGMASLNIDPQGKAYAQQLLEYPIPVSSKIIEDVKKNHLK